MYPRTVILHCLQVWGTPQDPTWLKYNFILFIFKVEFKKVEEPNSPTNTGEPMPNIYSLMRELAEW